MGRSRSAGTSGKGKASPAKKARQARSKTTGRHAVLRPAVLKPAVLKPAVLKPAVLKPAVPGPASATGERLATPVCFSQAEAIAPVVEPTPPVEASPEAAEANESGPTTLRSLRPAAAVDAEPSIPKAPRLPTGRLATVPMPLAPPVTRLATVPMAPLAAPEPATSPSASPKFATADEDETPRSIPAVVVSYDDAPASQPDPQSFLPSPRSRARRLLRRTPHLAHHVATRKRFWVTLVAAALVGLLIRERNDVMRLVARLPMPRSFAAAKPVAPPTPAPAPVVEPPACPPEMALVVRDEIRVCVDKWEASLVEVVAGEEVPWSPYIAIDNLASTGRTFKAVSKAGVVPQGYIDRDTAQVACEAGGKRLCQAAEWMAACEGPRRTTYPYGNDPDEKACNTHGRSPLGELFGATFKDHLYDNKVMNDPSLNALEGTVAKTGAFDKCTNGFGVYDMVGNLHEWTAEKKGVFHGGYYQDATLNGPGCRYATSAHFSSYHDYSTGFRCCKDAE